MNKPTYFDKFKCLAGACPDSCCKAGWEITVDDEAYDVYSHIEGDIGKKFCESLALGEDGDRVFKLDDNGVCPFYNCDGLCDLYIATGGKMTEICEHYPRFYEEFDLFTEAGVSISCPEAARLILSAEESAYTFAEETSDDEMLERLIDECEKAFRIIDECETADEAMIRILDRAARSQAKFDLYDLTPIDERIEISITKAEPSEDMLKYLCSGILFCTDILCKTWRQALEAGAKCQFEKKDIAQGVKKNYLKYLLFRYYLKAINIEDVLSQAMLIGAIYILPQVLVGDFAELCRCAAKEFEHDAENREALLDGFSYGEPLSLSEMIEAIGFEAEEQF